MRYYPLYYLTERANQFVLELGKHIFSSLNRIASGLAVDLLEVYGSYIQAVTSMWLRISGGAIS